MLEKAPVLGRMFSQKESSVGRFGKNVHFDIPERCVPREKFDLTQPHVFNQRDGILRGISYQLDFDPNRVGKLYDKKKKAPVSVYIVKTSTSYEPNGVSYYFISKSLDKTYGHVELRHDTKNNRLIVDFLKNDEPKRIGGVGKLADRIESKYCVNNNIPFTIVSNATPSSVFAHYKRGKRFFNYSKEKCPYSYNYLAEHFGTTDINEVLERMLTEAASKGKKADVAELENFYTFSMYLPKELAQKYAKEDLAH